MSWNYTHVFPEFFSAYKWMIPRIQVQGGGNICAMTVLIAAEWQPGHKQYCGNSQLASFASEAWIFRSSFILRLLTFVAPGRLLELTPGISMQLIKFSRVTFCWCSMMTCSMHWLEFIISRQATWSLGHPSLICAFALDSTKNSSRLVLKRIFNRFNRSLGNRLSLRNKKSSGQIYKKKLLNKTVLSWDHGKIKSSAGGMQGHQIRRLLTLCNSFYLTNLSQYRGGSGFLPGRHSRSLNNNK